MPDNTSISIATDVWSADDKPMGFRTCQAKQSRPPQFPPDKDIELWLKHNAPLTFQQLADIRYCLYHRCSRADFTIALPSHVISNGAVVKNPDWWAASALVKLLDPSFFYQKLRWLKD